MIFYHSFEFNLMYSRITNIPSEAFFVWLFLSLYWLDYPETKGLGESVREPFVIIPSDSNIVLLIDVPKMTESKCLNPCGS